jgi:hypothetical protein
MSNNQTVIQEPLAALLQRILDNKIMYYSYLMVPPPAWNLPCSQQKRKDSWRSISTLLDQNATRNKSYEKYLTFSWRDRILSFSSKYILISRRHFPRFSKSLLIRHTRGQRTQPSKSQSQSSSCLMITNWPYFSLRVERLAAAASP